MNRHDLENAQSSEIVYLIHSLDDLRQASSSSGHIHRNKFANAFAMLLSNEVDCKDDLKKVLLDDEQEN